MKDACQLVMWVCIFVAGMLDTGMLALAIAWLAVAFGMLSLKLED